MFSLRILGMNIAGVCSWSGRSGSHVFVQTGNTWQEFCVSSVEHGSVGHGSAFLVLPEDYCNKDPCNFNTEMFMSKVGNPCSTLGQFPASQILYALLVG